MFILMTSCAISVGSVIDSHGPYQFFGSVGLPRVGSWIEESGVSILLSPKVLVGLIVKPIFLYMRCIHSRKRRCLIVFNFLSSLI
jgi:hypothetical protein